MNDKDAKDAEAINLTASFKKAVAYTTIAAGLLMAFHVAQNYFENAKFQEINLGLNEIYDQSLLEQ